MFNGTSPNVNVHSPDYYPISGSAALLFDQDKTRIAWDDGASVLTSVHAMIVDPSIATDSVENP